MVYNLNDMLRNLLKYLLETTLQQEPMSLEFVYCFVFTPSLPNERSGHLKILPCLTPDDFTRQWGTPWTGKGQFALFCPYLAKKIIISRIILMNSSTIGEPSINWESFSKNSKHFYKHNTTHDSYSCFFFLLNKALVNANLFK